MATAEEKAAAEAAKKTEAEAKAAEAEAKKAAEEAARKGHITVKFLDASGVPAERTFSEDVHGKEYKALAAEFSTTHAERLIK